MSLSLLKAAAYRLRTRPLLGRWALRMIPDVPWTVKIDGIGPFRVRLRRNRSFWLREPLESESFPFAMLRSLVRPGDVVYDAGANLGLYARYLAGVLGAGRVFAFEPAAANRDLLAANLGLGGIASRVTVMSIALADEDGTLEFQVDDMQSASGTLSKVTGGEPCVGRKNLGLPPLTARVACRTLDSLVAAGELPPPDVIKIDIEGAEALLLRGASSLLKSQSPRLLVELHGAEMARDVLTILFAHGYSCVAQVSPEIAPSGFAGVSEVDASVLPRLTGPYDVHFIAASREPGDLPASWEGPA